MLIVSFHIIIYFFTIASRSVDCTKIFYEKMNTSINCIIYYIYGSRTISFNICCYVLPTYTYNLKLFLL